jgi:hypothetical protein
MFYPKFIIQEYNDIKTICDKYELHFDNNNNNNKLLMIYLFLKPRKNGYFHLLFNLIIIVT